MSNQPTIVIDGRPVPIEGERNVLELVRKAGIDLPTFCYHSELSVYGACRLCLVEASGKGIVASCSVPPEPGMTVRTNTEELREIRRITLELLLANHELSCPTCPKSATCKLLQLARRMGVDKVRFAPTKREDPTDDSSPFLVREPSKCILCGDCVRVCSEIQGIGAIDFARRGASVAVEPAFGKKLAQVECVGCGQCTSVCPTGALVPKSEIAAVWHALGDKSNIVVAQIAPAVRVALGEMFGLAAGTITTGHIASALKALGFAQVYDTSFSADVTVLEETHELLVRREKGGKLPLFTSCCPGWVRYAEQYHPKLLSHLSSCKSPQQMLGALVKETLPAQRGVPREKVIMVAIMPCTAKKGEAADPKFQRGGVPDVDHVLTTQELGRMIEEAGLCFNGLEPESLDMPFGMKTGAGVIFGTTGGVSEAVLRHAAEQLSGIRDEAATYESVRGTQGVREVDANLGKARLRLAVVHGLANAGRVARAVERGEVSYDLIEVMACPGGCVNGAGNPTAPDRKARAARAKGLYDADKMLDVHTSQENQQVASCYKKVLGEVGGKKAHELLHTRYSSRSRIEGRPIELMTGKGADKLEVTVCVGTGCYVRGAQELLRALMQHIERTGITDRVDVRATFCRESCDRGPVVLIGSRLIERCDLAKARDALAEALAAPTPRKEDEPAAV